MSENRGRRRIRVVATGRVGEPNVLSNAAAPNTLSGTVARPAKVQVGAKAPASPNAQPGANVQIGSRDPATGWRASGWTEPKSRRLPSFGTLLFLGFLVLTGLRLLGEFVQGLAQETPAATTPAAPAGSSEAGPIVFGAESDGDCGVLEEDIEFKQGISVWWSAKLPTVQSPDASVVIIVRRDGAQVDREDVPPDPASGKWSTLCSGAPVLERSAGLYRVEVWDETLTVLHAAGEYRLIGS